MFLMRRYFLAGLFFIFAGGLQAKDDLTARYSVTLESWAPYWIVTDAQVEGILNDLMQELSNRTALSLRPITPLPINRAKRLFKEGEIQVECCVNEAWRKDDGQYEVSLWSDVVMSAEEILIFPRNRVFPFTRLSDLKGKQLATIIGYGYVGDEYFIRNDTSKNISLIKMVANARVDGGIIDKYEYVHAINNYPELADIRGSIDVGPVINRSELKIRVHRSKPELIPLINEGLAGLRSAGMIDNILSRYVKDTRLISGP